MADPCDVLLTGLPRSGTTLACELLNRLPGTVALDEPMTAAQLLNAGRRLPWSRRTGSPRERAAANVAAFVRAQRRSLLRTGRAVSKQVDGRVVGAKVADAVAGEATRRKLASRGEVEVGKALHRSFTLAVKHNSAFAAPLPELLVRFPVHAVVRNPLATLSSWQTVPFAVGQGHATLAEALDPALARDLAGLDDRLERQLHLLDWFFRRFTDHLPPGHIHRYEDVVASDGRALAGVVPEAETLSASLATRNRAGVYARDDVRRLGEALLGSDLACWRVYHPSEVADLLAAAG